MTPNEIIFLMYHEIRMPHRNLCRSDDGYRRYAVDLADFKAQLAYLKQSGFTAYSVGDALDLKCHPCGVVYTFDDGCETDLIKAAPLLRELGFNATFYIVAGFVGHAGYLFPSQLRELADLGFEIGSHSMTHAFLTDLNHQQLRDEVVGSKESIEQIIGKRVDHFSCPGGRWNIKVSRVAQSAGYRSVATSVVGANSPQSDPFQLCRIPVLANTGIGEFAELISGKGLFRRRLRSDILRAAKWSLGDQLYDKIHRVVHFR